MALAMEGVGSCVVPSGAARGGISCGWAQRSVALGVSTVIHKTKYRYRYSMPRAKGWRQGKIQGPLSTWRVGEILSYRQSLCHFTIPKHSNMRCNSSSSC
eukprot:scaffold2789_cov108-Isochrysis_galbana.AAC.7